MHHSFGRRLVTVLAATLVVVSLVSACGGDGRPSADEWRPIWEGVLADFPTAVELGDPPDRSICTVALGELRTTSSSLYPTPDVAIESVVDEWVRVAEQILFECAPSSGVAPDLTSEYAELARLEAEVAVVLSIDSNEG
jgi:hypothetical protein